MKGPDSFIKSEHIQQTTFDFLTVNPQLKCVCLYADIKKACVDCALAELTLCACSSKSIHHLEKYSRFSRIINPQLLR